MSTTIASGNPSREMLLKVPRNKKIPPNVPKMSILLNSSYCSNKFKTSTCTPIRKPKSLSQNSFTTDLCSTKTRSSRIKNTSPYHSQELQNRCFSITSGPLDSPWVKQVTFLLKSGLSKIKMKRELLQLLVVTRDCLKNKEPTRNLRLNQLDRRKESLLL